MLVTVVLAARFSLCLPGSSSWLAFLAAQTYYQLFSPLTQLVGGWGLLFRKKSWCQNWSSLRKSALAFIAMGLLLQCWGISQSFPPSGENSKLWVLSMPNCEPNTSIRSKWQKRGNIQETIIYRYWHWNWHLFSLLIEHILDTYWTHIYISVGFKSLRRRGLGFSTSKWFWHTTNEGFPYTNHIPLIFDVEQRSCSYACWQMAPVLPEHESSFHFCGTCQCPFAVGSVLMSAQFSPFWLTPL